MCTAEGFTLFVFTPGLLSAVGSLNITPSNFTLSLTWEPPFTLDIVGVTADITYCVDVVDSTSSTTLRSQCDISETEFSLPLLDAVCYSSLLLTVTPVNVVGRGAPSSLSYIGTETGMLVVSKCLTCIGHDVDLTRLCV